MTDWIEWEGGECPVDGRTLVLIRLHHGHETKTPVSASSYRWSKDDPPHAYDIAAYRVMS